MICKKEISRYIRKQYKLRGDWIILCGTVEHYLPVLRKNVKIALHDISYNFLSRGKKVFVTVNEIDLDRAYDRLLLMNPFNYDHEFCDLKGDKWFAKLSSRNCLYASEKEPYNAFISSVYTKGGDAFFLFKRSHYSTKLLKKIVD